MDIFNHIYAYSIFLNLNAVQIIPQDKRGPISSAKLDPKLYYKVH